ncbi:MAG: 16S rRNA (uracil(1498)-N(3))-methyltransferase [Bacteroidota bacterium]
MQLFYNPQLQQDATAVFFSAEESRHLIKVLRKKEGDLVHITNGKGDLFTAEIIGMHLKQCTAQIVTHQLGDELRSPLHIAIAPTKMNDRMEWFLEKATEIGIQTITPILCERSERKVIKAERFQRVLQSAMKQSLRTYLPVLHPLVKLPDFINTHQDTAKYIAHCGSGNRSLFTERIQAATPTTLLIGPEGDFTENEVALAQKEGFVPVSLGNHRLRTETAGIMAAAAVAIKNEKN